VARQGLLLIPHALVLAFLWIGFAFTNRDRVLRDPLVEYPERLSRGLVLVKWWLLAIPH
jgi:hypothetical protein